jgi:hypothetical protein
VTTISSPGPYCAGVADDGPPPANTGAIGGSFDQAFTVGSPAPPIPEYPIGLPILAIFMIIGYGVIRRKTRYD